MVRTALGLLTVLLAASLPAQPLSGGPLGELPPRTAPGGVEFAVRAPGASIVTIAGSFNDWSTGRDRLRDGDGDGVFTTVLPLKPGRHEYLLFVNGRGAARGLSPDRETARQLQSHRPLDMAVHRLAPVFVLSVAPGGGLVTAPSDPALFALLDAARVRTSDVLRTNPDEHERVVRRLEDAIAQAPDSPWLPWYRDKIQGAFAQDEIVFRWQKSVRENDTDSFLRELLDDSFLSERERRHAAGVIRDREKDGDPHWAKEALGKLLLRSVWRRRVPGLAGRWRDSPGNPSRIHALLRALSLSYLDSDPAGFRAWFAGLLGRHPPGQFRELLDLSASWADDGGQESRVDRTIDWLRRNGLPPWMIGAAIFAPQNPGPRETAMRIAEALEDRPGRQTLHRDFVWWAQTFAPSLREEPRVRRMLATWLAEERDPFVAGRVAAFLGYALLRGQEEAAFYQLLEGRLRADPAELELLANFDSYLQTLDWLARENRGFIQNPWRRGLIAGLERLSSVAPSNPEVELMLAQELRAAGRGPEAVAALQKLLARDAAAPRAAVKLAEWLQQDGKLSASAGLLERSWEAQPGNPAVAAALARALAQLGRRERLAQVLARCMVLPAAGAAALAGAAGGLVANPDSRSGPAFLDALKPVPAAAAGAWLRARLRVELAAGEPPDFELDMASRASAGADPGAQLHYASLAAGCRGFHGLASRLLWRAIETSGSPRAWLLQAVAGATPEIARKAAVRGCSTQRHAAQFLRYLAHDAMAAGDWSGAAGYLERLEPLALFDEDARGTRCALALVRLRNWQVAAALQAIREAALADARGGLLFGVALLLPFGFAAALCWPVAARRQE